jgi:hypothetical protein
MPHDSASEIAPAKTSKPGALKMIARTAEASRIISEDRFRRNRVPLGRRGVPGTETLLGQSGAQEGQHAVSGYMAEGGKLQRVVAAVEFEGAEVRAVLA